MADTINELFLKLACNTPLPDSTASYPPSTAFPSIRPFTCFQAHPVQSDNAPFEAQPRSSTSASQQKKRSRKPEFTVFVDPDTASSPSPPRPAPKKSKLASRLPLAIKTDFGNDSPLPSPRVLDDPWTVSPDDPRGETENYFPYTTPPPTPDFQPPRQPFNNGPTPHETPRPRQPRQTPGPTPGPAPRRSPRQGPRQASGPGPQPSPRSPHSRASDVGAPRAPNNMVLYHLLELEDWNVGTAQINLAYRRAALRFHPDRVPVDERQEATAQMQRVNEAKEVLLDPRRRRAYHRNGRLPWDT